MSAVNTIQLWGNNGEAAIVGLDETKRYFDNVGDFSSGEFVSGPAGWHRLDVKGYDLLRLDYQAEIMDAGLAVGEVMTGAGNTRLTALGLGREYIVPTVVGTNPQANHNHQDILNLGLTARGCDVREQERAHTDDLQQVLGDVGFLYDGSTIATGDKAFWGIDIGKRFLSVGVTSADQGDPVADTAVTWPAVAAAQNSMGNYLNISGLGVIYLVPAMANTSVSGTADWSTTKIKAALFATLTKL